MTSLEHLEVWSDLPCAGGTRLGFLSGYGDPEDTWEVSGRELMQFTIPATPESGFDRITHQCVILELFRDGSVLEWRVAQIERQRETAGGARATISCESPLHDLGSTDPVHRVEADGAVRLTFGLRGLTVAEHVAVVMAFAPGWWQAGVIESTNRLDIEYDSDSVLSALRKIEEAAKLELEGVRAGGAAYQIHLRERVGAAAPEAHLRYARNIRGLKRREDATQAVTRVYPVGASADEVRATMGPAAWTVLSADTSTGWVALGGAPLRFDQQLVGAYLEPVANPSVRSAILASEVAGQRVRVALPVPPGLVAGSEARFRANARGDELTYLDNPTSTYRPRAVTLERSDIPGTINLIRGAFLETLSGQAPAYWSRVGTLNVLRLETSSLYRRHGSASVYIETRQIGAGLETEWVPVFPTKKGLYRYVTGQISGYLAAGRVLLELVARDAEGKETVFPDRGQAYSTTENNWMENFGVSGFDLFAIGAVAVKLVIRNGRDGLLSLYLDAAMLTPTAGGENVFYPGRGANDLHHAANDHLEENQEPTAVYDVDPVDLFRIDPTAFQYDELILGGDVQVWDAGLGMHVRTRIMELRRRHVEAGVTSLTLSSKGESLSDHLGARPRPVLEKREYHDATPERVVPPLHISVRLLRREPENGTAVYGIVDRAPDVVQVWVHDVATNAEPWPVEGSALTILEEETEYLAIIPPSGYLRYIRFEPRNEDGQVGPVVFITLGPDEIGEGEIDSIDKFAYGINFIVSVDELPATCTAGQVVYLTTDGKLYRCGPTGWTTSTYASDLVGQLTERQLAEGSITLEKFVSTLTVPRLVGELPLTCTPGEVVFLVSDSEARLYRCGPTGWTAAVPTADLVGKIVESQIADSAVSIAKMARDLSVPEIVYTLPPTGRLDQIVLYQGQLYVWNGGEWVSAVPTEVGPGSINETHIAPNAIRTPHLAANSVAAGKIAANAITAGTIAAAAIGAREIAAGEIATRHLFIGNLDNLAEDPGLEQGGITWLLEPGWAVFNSPTWARSGSHSLWFTGNSLTAARNGNLVSVAPGEQYYASVYLQSPDANGDARVRISWFNAAYQEIDVAWGDPVIGPGGWRLSEVRGTAPAAATHARAEVIAQRTVGTWIADDMYFRRMAEGRMIVDGSITARNIYAGAVQADRIQGTQIAAYSINASHIETGSLTSAVLATDFALINRSIRSQVYIPGEQGWIIHGDGLAEFNNVSIRYELAAGSVKSSHIYSGSVEADRIQANNIAVGAISAAKLASEIVLVGKEIRSGNYAVGTAGWKIDGTTAEFNNVIVRGTLDGAVGNFSGTLRLGEQGSGGVLQAYTNSNALAAEAYAHRVVLGSTTETGLHITQGTTPLATFLTQYDSSIPTTHSVVRLGNGLATLTSDVGNDVTAMALLVKRGTGAVSLERVTLGATGSGGTGFRVLRVPN